MSHTLRLEPVARVEGHGAITVELEGNTVVEARFDVLEGSRLISSLVRGRHYCEIPQLVSRVCAICCAAHTLTALRAIEEAFGIELDARTRLLRELLMRGGNIASHALHLFFLAVPDLLAQPSALSLAASRPRMVDLALGLKRLGNDVQEVIGGRAVHPVNLVPGGFSRQPEVGELLRLRDGLAGGLRDCQEALRLVGSLPRPSVPSGRADFAACRLDRDYSYLRGGEIVLLAEDHRRTLPAAEYRRLLGRRTPPGVEPALPEPPGEPFMVGALARLAVNSDRLTALAPEAPEKLGLRLPSRDPLDNNLAQAVELGIDMEAARRLVDELLDQRQPAKAPPPVLVRASSATAVTEAPRGLLIHGYTFDDEGRAVEADVVTPTALNVPCIDQHFRQVVERMPGLKTAELKQLLEQVARAYDPCLSCAVEVKRHHHAH